MRPHDILNSLKSKPYYRGQIHGIGEALPVKGSAEKIPDSWKNPVKKALCHAQIPTLYSHQIRAVQSIRAGQNTAINTDTSSGKSLCFWIPILMDIVDHPSSCALAIFPTKALARDQLNHLEALILPVPEITSCVRVGIYDGDIPETEKRRVRRECNVILTNPDTLHRTILPTSGRWVRFLSSLKIVVLDEMHLYKGVFGSQTALVMRRLKRICTRMGGTLVWVCSSATMNNAKDMGETVVGEPFHVITGDGAPIGHRVFACWDTGVQENNHGKKLTRDEEIRLVILDLVKMGAKVIVFAQTRLQCEILGKKFQETKEGSAAGKVVLYRAGFTASQRKATEEKLASGTLSAVISTSALEVGMDIGHLDVCVILGFPASLSSFKQQSGRVGRKTRDGLTLFIPSSRPVDQYILRHPDFLFSGTLESGYCDPHNPYLLERHLKYAAWEFPLSMEDKKIFGRNFKAVVRQLEKTRQLRFLKSRWYPRQSVGRDRGAGLRNLGERNYELMISNSQGKIIGAMDEAHFQKTIFINGIYLHNGVSFRVLAIDKDLRQIYLEGVNSDFFTLPRFKSRVLQKELIQEIQLGHSKIVHSFVTLQASTEQLKKIHFETFRTIGTEPVKRELPPLDSSAVLFFPSEVDCKKVSGLGLDIRGGLIGIQNIFQETLPLSALCDRGDFQVHLEWSSHPVIIVLDSIPGGVGLSQKVFLHSRETVVLAHETIQKCSCPEGCPSCVGYRPAESSSPGATPDKEGAKILLKGFLQGWIA